MADNPEPHLYASQSPVCAGIVFRVALLSEGGWDAFSKTPTASNPVICFRVELHLEPEPTRHSGADSPTAKDLSSPCGAAVRHGFAGGTEMEKVTGIGGLFFRAKDSGSVGALVPSLLRGDERLFRGYPQGLDGEFSSPGSRQNGSPATGRRNRGKDGPGVLSQRPVRPPA